jgi:hypothetical protein
MACAVFISYASEDEAAAKRVCATLEPEGLACWMAPRDIPPGGDWVQSIMGAISSSKLLVLILSGVSSRSGHVLREVERAVRRDLPILPVRIDDTVPDGNLAYFVSGSHWFDAPSGLLEGRTQLLVKAARELIEDPSRGWVPSSGERTGAAVAAPKERERATRRWRAWTVGLCLAAGAIAAGVLVITGGGGSGEPGTQRLAAGDERWSAMTRGPILSTPVVSGGRVVVGSDGGTERSLLRRGGGRTRQDHRNRDRGETEVASHLFSFVGGVRARARA